ncbi:MAG: CapA family protein [Clostridiales bacterium]|nr:CapA family protein [Clostridiales bacterium]
MEHSLTLLATGDLGPNRENPDSIFDGVREALKQGDLLFGQLDPCLAHTGSPLPQSRLPMRGDPAGGAAIARAGFNVISFATNHCMDWGREAFFETLEVIRENGMVPIGAGKDLADACKPYIVEVNGVKIAFLACCSILPQNYFATTERPGCAPLRGLTIYEQIEHDQPGTPARIHSFPLQEDLDRLVADIRAVRDQADIVAVSLHWGIHFVPAVIAQYQRIAAHAIIDAGADIILGHHTHILKPIEVYKGKPIIYSMANFALEPPFLFAENLDLCNSPRHKELQDLNPDWKKMPSKPMPTDSYKSLLLKVRIQDKKIQRVSFIPVQLDDDSNPRTLTPADPEFAEIITYMRDITADQNLDTRYVEDGDEVFVEL